MWTSYDHFMAPRTNEDGIKRFQFQCFKLKNLKLSTNLEPNPRTIPNKSIKLTPP
jgi:hypothetical protein